MKARNKDVLRSLMELERSVELPEMKPALYMISKDATFYEIKDKLEVALTAYSKKVMDWPSLIKPDFSKSISQINPLSDNPSDTDSSIYKQFIQETFIKTPAAKKLSLVLCLDTLLFTSD